jgi:hypothetical protein
MHEKWYEHRKRELPDGVSKLELGNQRQMKSFSESTEAMIAPGFHVNPRRAKINNDGK